MTDPTRWDHALVVLVSSHRADAVTILMRLASVWLLTSAAFLIAAVAPRAGRVSRPGAAVATLSALGIAFGLSEAAKPLFDRPRPFVADPSIIPIDPPASAAMPSSHAAAAFAAAGVVAVLQPRLREVAVALAVLVGVSRVYLGVHYPSDVVVGAAIGVVLGVSCAAVSRWFGEAGHDRAGGPRQPAASVTRPAAGPGRREHRRGGGSS